MGSCASFCFITKSEEKYHLLVGNVGDSRVILCKGNQCIPLTVDHKPNREDEETRIKHNGGTVTKKKNDVCRVNGVLSVSRAFGDQKLTKWVRTLHFFYLYERLMKKVSSEIEFQEEAAEVGDFLIICCDGLLETFTNEACVQYISERRSQTPDLNALAKQIAQESITSGSDDNVTVMLCEL